MHEQILRDFFAEAATATQLAADLVAALVTRGRVTQHPIVDMREEFHVNATHLIRVCDAALADELPLESLQAVGFCLQASSKFFWDTDEPGGERISEVTADWSAPSINFPLTRENVCLWRAYLETGEYRLPKSTGQLFAAADSRPFAGPALPRLALRRLTCQFARHVKAASG